jgi:hypothetical protein
MKRLRRCDRRGDPAHGADHVADVFDALTHERPYKEAWHRVGRRTRGKREAQAGPGPLVAGHLADDPRISLYSLPREFYPLAVTNKRPRASQARRQVVDATQADLDVNELLFGSADDNHLAQR